MAVMIMDLLRYLGGEVVLASRLRSYDREGSAIRQERLAAVGARLAARAADRLRGSSQVDAWVTYHCYHKAPDLIGPTVSRRLAVPYVIIEPSLAPRQARGPWAVGYAMALRALRCADLLLPVTRRDATALIGSAERLPAVRHFPPFLDAAPYRLAASRRAWHRARVAGLTGLDPDQPWLLTVAMMRQDVKRQSYRGLSQALAALGERPWQLLVVGDGEARDDVVAEFARFAASRVRFLGTAEGTTLTALYAASDLFVWPAFGEAYGMAMLEAQAAGLPVIACQEGGVADIVADGVTGLLTTDRDMRQLSVAVELLLGDPQRRLAMSAAASAKVVEQHDRPVAADRLRAALAEAAEARRRLWSTGCRSSS